MRPNDTDPGKALAHTLDTRLVQAARNQLAIAQDVQREIERKQLMRLLRRYPKAAIEGLSRAYPLTSELLRRYEEWWDWGLLSENEALPWSQALIERYEGRWNWEWLSGNGALPWSQALIERFEERWNWGGDLDFMFPEFYLVLFPALATGGLGPPTALLVFRPDPGQGKRSNEPEG